MIQSFTMKSIAQDFIPHNLLHPKLYIAPYTPIPLTIDGTLEKWSSIPFSSYFGDIIGNTSNDGNIVSNPPSPECSTRIKMMWDEQYLYILGYMQSNKQVIATYHERNSPIFHQDSDFEVFVDPCHTCHGYKELEMNALSTVWNLMLDKPYSDGGCEHSGRIAQPGDSLYYDVGGQRTCVQMLEGRINDPTSSKNTWIVEIALRHEDTLVGQTFCRKPTLGDVWRINFSRVEDKGNINWTWQPQRVWNPEQHVHEGQINMHLPDAWGYVRFGPPLGNELYHDNNDNVATYIGEISQEDILKGKGDYQWPGKLAIMNVYYAQQYHKKMRGHFASSLTDLHGWIDPLLLKPFQNSVVSWYVDESSFQLSILDSQGYLFKVTHDRLLTVTSPSNVVASE